MKRKQLWTGIFGSLGIFLLILDGKTALAGAQSVWGSLVSHDCNPFAISLFPADKCHNREPSGDGAFPIAANCKALWPS